MGWFGQWLGGGSGGGGGGSSSSPALGIETTAAAIRDRIIAVITGLTPATVTGDKFKAFLNEREGSFEKWLAANAVGCRRRVQVRQIGDRNSPEVSNSDFEERCVTFRIMISYPQTNRDGKDGALDRDDALDNDTMQIDHAIGMCGRANLAPPYPDACWRPDGNGERSGIREPLDLADAGVDCAVIYASYTYRRDMLP